MTTSELLKRLNEANFSFTKPYSKEEIEYSNEQKKSMNKLIVCRLAKEISTNKYVLTDDGKKANILGVEKWAKSLSDVERRNFVYDSFELKKKLVQFTDYKRHNSQTTIFENIKPIFKSGWHICNINFFPTIGNYCLGKI